MHINRFPSSVPYSASNIFFPATMATHENTNLNPSLRKNIITKDIFTCLPIDDLLISYVFSRLPVKTLLMLRSVSKSCMSLISSPYLIEPHLFKSYNDDDVLSCLPKLIIYNILLRLPVKTLLQLKSVSKSWLSLISSRDFVKTHYSKSNNDPEFTHHHLIVTYRKLLHNCEPEDLGLYEFKGLSLYSLLNEPEPATTEVIRHEDIDTKFMDQVVGCCKGLICLLTYYREDLILWNPSTGESRTLPKRELPNFDSRFSYYGFCYDEFNDDFKVFCIIGLRYSNKHEFSVYSSKTDCWRRIGDFSFPRSQVYKPRKGVFVNEAMYWDFGLDNPIFSLDIRTETIRKVMQPRNGDVCRRTLGIFGKNLSFSTFGNTHFDLWVMKTCGADNSWSKLFTIPYTDTITKYSRIEPIDICVNGDIIMMLDKHIQLYNSKDNTLKDLFDTSEEFYDGKYNNYCMVYTYAESLFSPLF